MDLHKRILSGSRPACDVLVCPSYCKDIMVLWSLFLIVVCSVGGPLLSFVHIVSRVNSNYRKRARNRGGSRDAKFFGTSVGNYFNVNIICTLEVSASAIFHRESDATVVLRARLSSWWLINRGTTIPPASFFSREPHCCCFDSSSLAFC